MRPYGSFKRFIIILLSIFLESFSDIRAGFEIYPIVVGEEDYVYVLQEAQKNRSQGNYEEAVLHFDKAINFIKSRALTEKLSGREGLLEAIEGKGLVLWNLGQMKEAAECFKEGMLLARQWKMAISMSFFEGCLEVYELYQDGKNKRGKMDYRGAINSFEKALFMARKLRSPELELKCLRQASLVFFDQNELEKFRILNERGLRIARLLSHKLEEGRFLNNIALYHLEKRDLINSFAILNRSSILIDEKGTNQDKADCLYNLGLSISLVGFFDRAIKYFKEAMILDEKEGKIENIILDLNNIGLCLLKKGELNNDESIIKESLSYFHKGLKLSEKNTNVKMRIMILNNLAIAFNSLGKRNKAQSFLNEALSLSKKSKDTYSLITVNDTAGSIHADNEPKLALEYLFEALSHLSKLREFPEEWIIHYNIGRAYENINRNEQALRYYNRSIELIDSLRKRISYDFYQVGFLRNKEVVFDALIRLKKKMHDQINNSKSKIEVFEAIEKTKGKSFLFLLNSLNLSLNNKKEDIQDTEDDIEKRKGGLFLHDSLMSSEKKQFKQIREEDIKLIKIAEKKYQSLNNIEKIVNAKILTIEEIQSSLLDEKSAIFEYYIGHWGSIGILITKRDFHIINLPTKEEIEKLIIGYSKLISNQPLKKFAGEKAAERIYLEIIKPLEERLPNKIENLIIIPDGYIYYLPFEALMTKIDGKLEYLVKKYNMIYAPSVSSLFVIKKENKENEVLHKEVLAIGYPKYKNILAIDIGKNENKLKENMYIFQNEIRFKPLPYSRKEIKYIKNIFGRDKIDVLMREKAKESILKNMNIINYKIIHFACHGYIDESFPFRSSLILTPEPDKGEDGFLQAHEISELVFNAKLVVLSACQSARGPLEKAEGILGLNRVFFTSGAKAVISSLRQVNDRSSADLMGRFYKHLRRGITIAEALREAKIDMLKTKFNHPFYWAGFILSGDGFSILFGQN
ncbi:MAG: CHAT domain-containing protein [Candidatus Aminicenantes bacterium]|nr:CHAT domain-containing protein [Candidatus Aminicenantes bacterium]